MNLDVLLSILIEAALAGLLAFLAAWLLKMRPGVLGLLGAGLLGKGVGHWLGTSLGAMSWPVTLSLSGASVHVLWTFIGALLVLFVARLLHARTR